MREINLKNMKPRQKNYIFGAMRRCNKAKMSRFPKGVSRTSTECMYQNFNIQLNLKWRLRGIQTQKIIKLAQKSTFLSCEGCDVFENPPKGISMASSKCTYKISTSKLNLEGYKGTALFQDQNEESPSYLPT